MTTATTSMLSARAGLNRFGRNSQDRSEEYERIKAAVNDEAKENWNNETWHREQAAILAQTLDYQVQFQSPFNTYLDVRNVGEFEKVYVRERRGLKVFYTHRGGYIEESQLSSEQWELPRDTIGFHVSEFEDKLRANFAETMEAMAAQGAERLDAEVNRRHFTLLQEAIPATSPYFVNAAGTGLTPAVLNAALRQVRDAVKPNGTGPVPVTIIGRAAAVDAISDFPGFGNETLEEIRTNGRLGNYRGANLVQLLNYVDEDGLPFVPENEVYVFGGTVGLFALYGGLLAKTWVENTVDYRHYRARRDFGGLVHHPEQARRIRIA